MALCARAQVLEALYARITALAWVGGVVANGELDEGMPEAFKNKQAWCKVATSPDDAVELPNQSGSPNVVFEFEARVVVMFTPDIEGVPDVAEGTSVDIIAAQIHAELQKAILGETEETQQLGGKVRKIDCVGGGAAGYIEIDTSLIDSMVSDYVIQYRHPFNKPGVLR